MAILRSNIVYARILLQTGRIVPVVGNCRMVLRVCGKDLGRLAKRFCLVNGQIRDSIAWSSIVDRARGLEGILPSF